jgi:hypothetical protein
MNEKVKIAMRNYIKLCDEIYLGSKAECIGDVLGIQM